MAKSQGDKIDELSQLTATLTERLDSVRRDIETVNVRGQRLDDSFQEVRRNLAVIDERLSEMKRGLEESDRRRWSIVPSLIGALIGGGLTFLGQLVIRRLFP